MMHWSKGSNRLHVNNPSSLERVVFSVSVISYHMKHLGSGAPRTIVPFDSVNHMVYTMQLSRIPVACSDQRYTAHMVHGDCLLSQQCVVGAQETDCCQRD